MYYSLPAIMSSEKYMIVFDNSANGWLDIGKTDKDVLTFEAMGGRTAYIVIAGDTYPALVENYTDVTGRQPLPPRWAFGNFASRFGYHSEEEVRDVVRRFRRAKIPLDTVIIDIYWFGPDIKGHMKCVSASRGHDRRFPKAGHQDDHGHRTIHTDNLGSLAGCCR
jgi:oligosaccharide 4-alpha-D-glucosyltransferase